MKTPPEKQESNEIVVCHLLCEVGSLLFLSFETNKRGSMAKMIVETAIPTRQHIFVSTKENSFCSEAFSPRFFREKTSMSLSIVMFTGINLNIQIFFLCQINAISLVQFCSD